MGANVVLIKEELETHLVERYIVYNTDAGHVALKIEFGVN